MVYNRPLIFEFSSLFINPLVTVPRALIAIGITVTFMFHSVFNSLERLRYLSFFLFTFNITLWSARTVKFTIQQVLFFLLIITWSGCLVEIRWSLCISKFQRSLCISFSRTDSGLCMHHFNSLHNSQWIILPTQSCLLIYTFCASLLHSLIMWLIFSSLSPHNLHLLPCCVLSILVLIWLNLMALFNAAIRRNSVFSWSFPFLDSSTFSRDRCRLLVVYNVHRFVFLPIVIFRLFLFWWFLCRQYCFWWL